MGFSEEMIQKVWEKGEVIKGHSANEIRKDKCTAWIKRGEYGNRNSNFGWEIDHITPKSKGGSDSLYNLRPLQWENNVVTSDGRLTCSVKSSGNKNI